MLLEVSAQHFQAVLLCLAILVGLAVSCYGWGIALGRLLNISNERLETTQYVWIGWVSVLLVLQASHLFLPLNAGAVIPTYAFGLFVGGLRLWRIGAKRIADSMPPKLSSILGVGLLLLAAAWLSSRAMLSPENYDSGLYHFNTIRWANLYPVIPGLGNLHNRLALNQAFFSYAASLDFYPFFGNGRSIANVFLMLLALATVFEVVRSATRLTGSLLAVQPFRFLPAVALAPLLVLLGLTSINLASPSPDLPSTLIQAVIFLYLARWLSIKNAGEISAASQAQVLLLLSVTLLTVKLSTVVFTAAVIAIVLVRQRWMTRDHPGAMLPVWAMMGAILLVHALRGYLLSGAPLYPAAVGYLAFEWSMPRAAIEHVNDLIVGWSRTPGAISEGLQSTGHWVPQWWSRVSSSYLEFSFPITMGVIFLLLCVAPNRPGQSKLGLDDWVLLAPLIISMLFWLATAPDLRFAHAIFFLWPIATGTLWLARVWGSMNRRGRAVACLMVSLACNLVILVHITAFTRNLFELSTEGFRPTRQVSLEIFRTESGLEIFVPSSGDQVWDSPLPATPYPDAELRLRSPGDLSKGFTVMDSEE